MRAETAARACARTMSDHPSTSPTISVVIGAYNAAESLSATLESVLAQSFDDLECIVVNDASEDSTADRVEAFARRDSRVRLITMDFNGGLTRALVRGVAEARGAWLARIDAGDRWEPEKLARQLAYADAHTDVALIGSWTEETNLQTGVATVRRKPVDHDAIMSTLWRACPFVHSTILVRLDQVRACGGYDPAYRYAQDYDLYFRLLHRTRGHNLPEVLCDRTTHDTSALSFAHWKPQLRCSLVIRWKYHRLYNRPWFERARLLPEFALLALPAASKRLKQRLMGPRHAR